MVKLPMTKKYATDSTIDYLIQLRRWEIEQIADSVKKLAKETDKPPTPDEVETSLEQLRQLWRDLPDKIENERLSPSQASKEIERIKQLRSRNRLIERQKASEERLRQLKNKTELPDGVYRNAKTQKIYKVKRSIHGSGLKVAHELIIEKDTNTGRFTYVGLATKYVKLADKLSLKDAKKFGALYGVCCNCGRTLTKEESIKAGIGPICAGKDIW